MPAELHAELLAIVRHRMSSNPVKVEAEINLTCFGIDGVDALKAALLAARQVGTAEIPISVTVKAFAFPVCVVVIVVFINGFLIEKKASPVYTLSAIHVDKALATDLLNKAIEQVKLKIATFPSGQLEVKTAPKVVTMEK